MKGSKYSDLRAEDDTSKVWPHAQYKEELT